jgi:membrane-associated phospholipid phosphatase
MRMLRSLTQRRVNCFVLWVGLAIGTAVLLVVGSRVPVFPGDVVVARWLQSVAPSHPAWAQWITATAKAPWVLVLGGLAAVLSWALVGWRAGLLAVVGFAGVRLGEPILKGWIGRPRPTANMIHVLEKVTGSSLPSGLVLVYTATFGLLLALALWESHRSRSVRWATATAFGAMLILGGAARIVLGAHWPSDVVLSYMVGFLWIGLLVGLHRSWKRGDS